MNFLFELKESIGFTSADQAVLLALHPILQPHFDSVADRVSVRVLEALDCSVVDLEAQVKKTLVEWMDFGLRGPHDEEFAANRARLSVASVDHEFDPQHMVTATAVIRTDYLQILHDALASEPVRLREATLAINRLLDLELGLMHHASKKDSEQRLRRQERLATLGQVAGSIGHDLRSPLAVISSSNYLLRCRIGDDPSLVRHLDKIDVEVGACQKIISDLLEMTRLRPPRVSHHLAIDCIRGALERINLPANVTLTTHADPDLPLLGEIGLLQQALINMVGNSLKAVGSRGTIAISAEVRDGNFVALTVEDDGPGFDAEILPRAFEPLVSSRGGTGLGLALVVSVAQRHGGTAVAENTRNGARVTILLPKQPSD